MMNEIAPDHPRQKLVFFITSDISESLRKSIERLVNELGVSREWILGPPIYISFVDEPDDVSKGDRPIETTGGYIELYSALPPWSLPEHVDRVHLEEVVSLIDALRDFSKKHSVSFEFELDGDNVGAIEDGVMDKCLSVGLIGEWKRKHGLPPEG